MTVYKGIGPERGHVVSEEEAFDYALERSLHGTLEDQRDFKEILVEWFYSGNWIKEDLDNESGYECV